MTKARLKNTFANLLKIGFAAGLIVWLARSGRFDVKMLRQLLDPQFLVEAVLILVTSFLCVTERWRALLHAQGFYLSFFETMKLSLIGTFFNFAMPGGVGGDLIKGYYVVRSQADRKFDSAMTILMDRVFGLYIMVFMAAAAVVVGFDQIWNHATLQVLAVGIILLFLTFSLILAMGFSARVKTFAHQLLPGHPIIKRLLQIWQSLVVYRRNPMTLVRVFGLSLLGQTCTMAFFILAGRYLGFSDIPVTTYVICCLVGMMVTAIPISPAGIGVGQAALGFLFAELAGPSAAPLGTSLATASQLFQFLLGLAGAFFYIQIKSHTPLPVVDKRITDAQ